MKEKKCHICRGESEVDMKPCGQCKRKLRERACVRCGSEVDSALPKVMHCAACRSEDFSGRCRRCGDKSVSSRRYCVRCMGEMQDCKHCGVTTFGQGDWACVVCGKRQSEERRYEPKAVVVAPGIAAGDGGG